MSLPAWWPSWRGETVVIVASGPSAAESPIYEARGKARFIAINKSWEIAPWSDILFGCDYAWWKSVGGCPDFKGLKLTTEYRATNEPWGVQHTPVRKCDDRLFMEELGTVGWGGNSGFQALNLVAQFGAKKVLLVGYDMTVRNGLHWFGKHEGKLNNPTERNAIRWRRAVDNAATDLVALGIRVINCSSQSALVNYEKMDFREALSA